MELKFEPLRHQGGYIAHAGEREVHIFRAELGGKWWPHINSKTGTYRTRLRFTNLADAKTFAERAVDALDALEGQS